MSCRCAHELAREHGHVEIIGHPLQGRPHYDLQELRVLDAGPRRGPCQPHALVKTRVAIDFED
ncbi:MAG TPA: hypothetical protein VFA18_11530, partial [Gemmataceae bacterium]|nr:hypothetical protein [Gemmataceae bacterium]